MKTKNFLNLGTIGLLCSLLTLESCSNITLVNKRTPASFEDVILKNPEDVKKYIDIMRIIGGDGSLSFTSSWIKKSEKSLFSSETKSTREAIDEAKNVSSEFSSGFDNKILESKTILEEKDVCEKWKPYTQEEEKYSKNTSSSSGNRSVSLGLSTAAAAAAAGLVGAFGLIGVGIGAIASVTGIAGGFLKTSGSFSSNYSKSSEDVNYYYIKNGLMCDKSARYVRATIRLTPDLLTLHPQQSALLIYQSIDKSIEELETKTLAIHKASIALIDNPNMTKEEFAQKFESFTAAGFINKKYTDLNDGMISFAADFREALFGVKSILRDLKKDQMVNEFFGDRLSDIEAIYQELPDTFASLEDKRLVIGIDDTKTILLTAYQIKTLNGVAFSTPVRNQSLVDKNIAEKKANEIAKKEKEKSDCEKAFWSVSTIYTGGLYNSNACYRGTLHVGTVSQAVYGNVTPNTCIKLYCPK